MRLFSLFLSLFLANFEISIVATSLVAITDHLHGFNKNSWIVTAYLVGYTGLYNSVAHIDATNWTTGFIIVWAKISDIYGRKPMQLLALFVFTIFSGACGAAQSVTQL